MIWAYLAGLITLPVLFTGACLLVAMIATDDEIAIMRYQRDN